MSGKRRCLWLDSSPRKACSVLVSRLGSLGYRVVCRSSMPDTAIIEMSRALGCLLVTSDKRMCFFARTRGVDCVYISNVVARRKSSRDLATMIIKLAAR